MRRQSAAALALAAASLAGAAALLAGDAAGRAPGPAAGSARTGADAPRDARLDTFTLESRVFGNTRTVRVWLPPGYGDAAGRRYPVLYLNDGQTVFAPEGGVATGASRASRASGASEAEGGSTGEVTTWRAGRTAASLIRAGRIEPVVIVGIDNAGAGRAREYLPWPDPFLDPPEPAPEGRRYVDFMRDEVIPAVEARYRVRRDAAGRALGGASYGALVAAYVAAADPSLFDGLLLESPSLYVDDGHIFRHMAEAGPLSLRRVYLGVGTNEVAVAGCGDSPWNREAVGDVRRMAALLEATAGDRRGAAAGARVGVVVEECAVHAEAAWARRLPRALEHLFGP